MATDTTYRVNASLPKQLAIFVEHQAKTGGFSGKADYVRHILRKEMQKMKKEQIRQLKRELELSEQSELCDDTPSQIKSKLEKVIRKARANTEV